ASVAPSAGLVIETSGGRLPDAAMPHASSSITRLKFARPPATSTRTFDVVIGTKPTCRHTRLLFVIAPPGTSAQPVPVQYCTSKLPNVIVGVGSTGAVYVSCIEKTSTSSISFNPLKSTSSQSGHVLDVPSHQPPPAPQPTPLRSPLIAAAGG